MTENELKEIRPIIEIFNSIEGESVTMGEPTIFVRLSGCNLRCMFANSICDTAYSSFDPEKGKYSYQDVIDMLEKHPLTPSISVSGGEPTLYPNILIDLIEICKQYDRYLIIETNGSICLDKRILKNIDLLNISPKLSSSEPTQEKCDKLGLRMTELMKAHSINRYNKEALWRAMSHVVEFRLKYVVGSIKDFVEIKQQILDMIEYDIAKKGRRRNPLIDKNGKELWYDMDFIRPQNIVLMPAGETNDHLNQNRKMVAEYCAKNGYSYSDRLQILIWNTEKER